MKVQIKQRRLQRKVWYSITDLRDFKIRKITDNEAVFSYKLWFGALGQKFAVISDVEITICPIADDEECFGKYK